VTVSFELELDHVVVESASVTVQLLGRSQSVSQFKLCFQLCDNDCWQVLWNEASAVFYGFRKGLYFIEN
jgi:hypothetical protein